MQKFNLNLYKGLRNGCDYHFKCSLNISIKIYIMLESQHYRETKQEAKALQECKRWLARTLEKLCVRTKKMFK